jgi:large subunit ribosomal protein L18
MVNRKKNPTAMRRHKALCVRKKIRSVTDRPRLSVFRSLRHIGAQLIDDTKGQTLASASSNDKALRDGLKGLKKVQVAERVGQVLAERAKQAGVTRVAFDRGSYKYHGRIKALAEAARKGGLEF